MDATELEIAEQAQQLLRENPHAALVLMLMQARAGLPFAVDDAVRAGREWERLHGPVTTESVTRWIANQ